MSFSLSSGKGKKQQQNPDHPVNPVGNKPLAEKTIEEVLLYFGDTLKVARRRYRHFVKQGVDQGSRPELQGGGLLRSAGGDKRALLRRKREERELSDERILGSGDFVNEILRKAGEKWEKGKEKRMPLAQLIEKVASHLDLKEESISSTSRRREISEARSIVSYLAINEMGYSASEVGRALLINRENASRGAARGKKALDKYEDLKDVGN